MVVHLINYRLSISLPPFYSLLLYLFVVVLCSFVGVGGVFGVSGVFGVVSVFGPKYILQQKNGTKIAILTIFVPSLAIYLFVLFIYTCYLFIREIFVFFSILLTLAIISNAIFKVSKVKHFRATCYFNPRYHFTTNRR